MSEDKTEKTYSEQAAEDREKDAEDLRKSREGQFDADAETARVRDQVINAAPPGEDPDSKQRLAKHFAAAPGVDVPEGLSVDPVTQEDREAHVAKYSNGDNGDDNDAESDADAPKRTAAQKRAAARPTGVQGRTSAPAATTHVNQTNQGNEGN